jgi:hypothetical protein
MSANRFGIVAGPDLPVEVQESIDWIDPPEDRWFLVDTSVTPWAVVGFDGGEPEDQTFTRDWSWVVDALESLAAGKPCWLKEDETG